MATDGSVSTIFRCFDGSKIEPIKKLSDVDAMQTMKQKVEASAQKSVEVQKPFAVAGEMTSAEIAQKKADWVTAGEKIRTGR
ncbi:MAG: hypothetical protein R2764_08665 [Bacteroidales bacterium]